MTLLREWRTSELMPTVVLRPSTQALLTEMDTPRRDMEPTGRKGADGFWIFAWTRSRSIKDFDRIVKFERCPPRIREGVQRKVDAMLSEAAYFERKYG